jgi:hypothetical protein
MDDSFFPIFDRSVRQHVIENRLWMERRKLVHLKFGDVVQMAFSISQLNFTATN